MPETGGEAYRQSFAYSHENPSAENRRVWANTVAHELFHYWNGSRLRGQDYSSTQWFQEGFTEYVANLTLLVGRIFGPDEFLGKLSTHVANYGRLTTSLEGIGNRKGPPLYSAGALVAFSFDAMIRASTQGKSSLGTFFRRLWLKTGEGAEKYAWADIQAALDAVAPGNWAEYHARFIRGQERLPLADAFRLAGLQLELPPAGSPRVSPSPIASSAAKAVWEGLNSRM
jgi:predicted metalloprotease with PDZ domain